MTEPKFYAHSLEGEPVAKWQTLEEHLRGVAERAESFACEFGGGDEARVAGWLHDLGKFREEFQSYLRKERKGGIDTHHAVYGAALAFQKNWPCAFAIAGHPRGFMTSMDYNPWLKTLNMRLIRGSRSSNVAFKNSSARSHQQLLTRPSLNGLRGVSNSIFV
jgi:CRISPR-associated endonuclease Cas3-HD